MSRRQDRDQLVAQLARELPEHSVYTVAELARKLLRAGATLQRLAVAQCNGDWPADGPWNRPSAVDAVGECIICGSYWAGESLSKSGACRACRCQRNVSALLEVYGMRPIFDGDPRGPVLKVIPASYAERNAGRDVHNLEGIYVS